MASAGNVVKVFVGLIPFCIYISSIALSSRILFAFESAVVGAVLAGFSFPFLFVIIAGIIGFLSKFSVVPGVFPRDPTSLLYFGRLVYGTAWTTVFYSPVYHICTTFLPLKWLLFRLFGYTGSMNFTTYADSWIRDLRLLKISDGAYVSNKATLGTNIVLPKNKILVDSILLGEM